MRTVVGRMGSGRRSALDEAVSVYQRRPAANVRAIAMIGPMTVATRQTRVAMSVVMSGQAPVGLLWKGRLDTRPFDEGSAA